MISDYLIVGPSLELRLLASGRMPRTRGALVGAFSVTRNGQGIAQAMAQMTQMGVEMMVSADQAVPDSAFGEAYRLLARISSRQTGQSYPLWAPAPMDRQELAAVLTADGFAPVGGQSQWRRPPGSFVLPEQRKFEANPDVYRDPFCVPWNFAAREWDVMARLVADSRQPAPAPRSGPLRVLDLGCGYGKNATALEDLGFAVHGIDVSAAAVARCRQLVKHPDRYVAGSAVSLPWQNESFDCVLDVGCLHCLPSEADRRAAVREIARVLAPLGALYSRSFKPRSREWLSGQPFKVTAFGLTPDQILDVIRPCLEPMIWQQHDDHNYVVARKRAAG